MVQSLLVLCRVCAYIVEFCWLLKCMPQHSLKLKILNVAVQDKKYLISHPLATSERRVMNINGD